MTGLIQGRNIHYVAFNDHHLAGMIIGVVNQAETAIDAVIFTNMVNSAGEKNFGMQFHQNVKYSEYPSPGTWHFIEQV